MADGRRITMLKQIIQDAIAAGMDPVQAVHDYLTEKDSRVTWTEAKRIVERNSPAPTDGREDEGR
jgi:hypothetical protein